MAARAIYYEMGGEEDFDKFYNRDFYRIVAKAALEAAFPTVEDKELDRALEQRSKMIIHQSPEHKKMEDIILAAAKAYRASRGGHNA